MWSESWKQRRCIIPSSYYFELKHYADSNGRIKTGDKIRALYGHSIPMHISKQKVTPPDVLYHGTTHKAIGSVMNEGLKLMGRQYVHLSVDRETAFSVGRRRDKNPIILLIDSKKAFADGIAFYSGNDKVYLSDSIPSEYISF